MSFFGKALASIGIGAAEVDAVLDSEKLRAGEKISGKVYVAGGKQSQRIDRIYLGVLVEFEEKVDDKKVTRRMEIDRFAVSEPFTIEEGEKKEIPFSFELPVDTPLTRGKTKAWVRTGLDIKSALDPTDKDEIKVEPPKLVYRTMKALNGLGFHIKKAQCEKAPRGLGTRLPIVQEFEYKPQSGEFKRKLDELEVVFLPKSHREVDVIMEVDSKAHDLGSFLAEITDTDEKKVKFTVTDESLENLEQNLDRIIRDRC